MVNILPPCRLSGTVRAPASKSYTQRLLILAAFSTEHSSLVCNELCDDVLVVLRALRALGAEITVSGNRIEIEPVKTLPTERLNLDLGESGAALRFLLPVLCALGACAELKMSEGLSRRPIAPLISELIRCGADIKYKSADTIIISGKLKTKSFRISADVSSQFLSGILLALAVSGGGEVYITSEISSAGYVEMTLECLKLSGIEVRREGALIKVIGRPRLIGEILCEGDWSGAAFFLCAGAIGKKPIEVTGLNIGSLQGDREILNILKSFGAELIVNADSVTVIPKKLCAVELNADCVPDLVPALAIVCANAEGVSVISGVSRLRTKESDRIDSVCGMINALGGLAFYEDGAIKIFGTVLKGGYVKTQSDHRIAMSAAIASNAAGGDIIIDDFNCHGKSYPGFRKDFDSLKSEAYI